MPFAMNRVSFAMFEIERSVEGGTKVEADGGGSVYRREHVETTYICLSHPDTHRYPA